MEDRKVINDLIFEVTGVCAQTAPNDATLESLGLDILDVWDLWEAIVSRFSIITEGAVSCETTIGQLVERLKHVDFTGAC